MANAAAQIAPSGFFGPELLRGYRFSLCETAASVERALDVRRQVYVSGKGYDVPVPDDYDQRSWILLAEHEETGMAVGTMRITPRSAGPFEAEESFDLPARLRSPKAVELNRFAILPAYRKGKTFIPVVSVGIFKLVHDFLRQIGAQYMVIASKPERLWTYEWLCFERTGLVANYQKLDNSEHELLWCHFANYDSLTEGHPVRQFLIESQYREVVLPRRTPRLGIVDRAPAPVLRLMAGSKQS